MQKKNLILIHLESISNTILWQYRIELGTVWRLMQQSFVYNHFYATSTSTDSVLEELFKGCSDFFDGVSLYRDRYNPENPWVQNKRQDNTLDTMASLSGYDLFFPTEHYLSPPLSVNSLMLDYNINNLLAASAERMAKAKAAGRPILIAFRMVVSHMAYDDGEKIQATTFSDRFRRGYVQLDRAINQFLSIIIQLGMWDDSIIVCYGDHGDELWSHGVNKGYCHAIQPYASLNWVPLFIHESNRPPGSSNRLVSTIDLRESLLKMLSPGFDPTQYQWPETREPFPPFRQTPYDGIDAFNERRELAFGQNLFALQLEYTDLERGLTKGYSVTDGTYRVVVSSGGSNPKNGGLEFYCDPVDPANTRNLLDFFTLDANGDIRKFSPPAEATDRAFAQVFNERAVASLRDVYHRLKKNLYEFVRDKERRGSEFNPGPKHVMPESVFRHARKRLFKD